MIRERPSREISALFFSEGNRFHAEKRMIKALSEPFRPAGTLITGATIVKYEMYRRKTAI